VRQDPAICRHPWRAAFRHRTKPSLRRLHAHEQIAKISRTRRWRVTAYGHPAMGTSLYLREHHFPNVYATAATLSPRVPRLRKASNCLNRPPPPQTIAAIDHDLPRQIRHRDLFASFALPGRRKVGRPVLPAVMVKLQRVAVGTTRKKA